MAFFPKIGPFYDPDKEQEIYTDSEGRLKARLHAGNSENNNFERPILNCQKNFLKPQSLARGDDFRGCDSQFGSSHFHSVSRENHHISDRHSQNKGYHVNSPQNGHQNQPRQSQNLSFDAEDFSSQVPRLSEPMFSIGDMNVRDNSDFLLDIDDPLSAHFNNSVGNQFENNFYDHNTNAVFNSRFRGSDHSSCSFGSEKNQSFQTSEKKRERNKDVYLTPRVVDAKRLETSGIALCEQLFGIVLLQYNQKPGTNNTVRRSPALRERKVIVQDVIQGSPADFTNNIHRGDMLISVNNIQASWMNLGSIFRALSQHMETKLTLKSPLIIGTPPHPSKGSTNLYRRLTNTSVKQGEKTLSDCIYGVLYLTLDDVSGDQSGDGTGDILYQYPSNIATILQTVRGVFLTLAHSLVDITGQTAKSSSMLVNGILVNISYIVNDRDVFLLVLPANRVCLNDVNSLCREISQLLNILYCDMTSAFKHANFHKLDQMLALAFRRVLTSEGSGVISRFFESEAGLRKLWLSDENRVICDEILSEFEAFDFDEFLPDDVLEKRRQYTSLGSVLFYKNWLLTSHVSQSIQSDINLYLKLHSLYLIMATKSLDNLVIWEEIFPSCYSSQCITSLPGYQEPSARRFLLIVGLNNYLLCTVLESGGISHLVEGNPSVDNFYVDQMKSTIEQLDEDDASMTECCEESIQSNEVSPTLASLDQFLPRTRTKDDSPQKLPSSPKTGTPVKSKFSPHFDRQSTTSDDRGSDNSYPNISRQGSKLSYGSNDSTGSSNSASQQKHGKLGRFSSMVDGINKSLSVLHLDGDVSADSKENRLSRGKLNVLFNYIELDRSEGILITPTTQQLAVKQNMMMSQLLNSMYHCCSKIRQSFRHNQSSTCSSSHISKNKHSKQQAKFENGDVINDVQEMGVLFQIPNSAGSPESSNKKHHHHTSQPLSYWVVGRRIRSEDSEKELYVCFHESVSQSTIEMAFRLGFGS
ncbi:hypothetical protein LOTGIDRAFT_164993 [Lottia gigantea]|uniref:Protein inturned n=1 Tax=Lottia gigantea TaxID=225164 RepID=V4A806_LOTGI|nr:hypothetical protein LOTGIDRAFT_164993 [Lottia gigantea]ESO89401.1 hypothetical protein LOTGIDRAFT_164993 [Lottia gigantea]